MEFGRNEQATVNTRNFSWQGRNYLAPVQCNIWAAYAFLEGRDKLNDSDYQ